MGRAATSQEKAVFGHDVEIGADDKPIEKGIGAAPPAAPDPKPEAPVPPPVKRAVPKAAKVHPARLPRKQTHSRHGARH